VLTSSLAGRRTWKAEPGEVGQAVTKAIEAGYTYLDLAKNYENQEEVGKGIKDGLKSTGKKREDLYILSKLWNTQHKQELVVPAIKDTLKELDLQYLDMWLIHWPVSFDAEGAGKDPHKVSWRCQDERTAARTGGNRDRGHP
jgi:diketogulonate reductase-like aldo/keto reductase